MASFTNEIYASVTSRTSMTEWLRLNLRDVATSSSWTWQSLLGGILAAVSIHQSLPF